MVTVELIRHEQLREHLETYLELLSHKPELVHWLLKEVLSLSPDELRTDTAVTKDGEKWVGNISLLHSHGIGLIGCVYLDPDYRRRGFGSMMMQTIDDLATHEGHQAHVLWVNPHKRPVAFSMYKKHGYVSQHGTGLMVKKFEWRDPFSLSPELSLVPLSWKHYPQLNLLTSLGNCDTLITFLYHCYGFATFETEFLNLMHDPDTQGWAIESDRGCCVGAILMRKDPMWEQQRDAQYENTNFLFDVIIEARHASHLPGLLEAFPFPQGRITTYVNVPGPKYAALAGIFSEHTVLERHFSWQGTPVDVAMLILDK